MTDNSTGIATQRMLYGQNRSTVFSGLTVRGSYTVSVSAYGSVTSSYTDATITLGDGSVENLTAISTSQDSISVSWKRPAYPQKIRWYVVKVFDKSSVKVAEKTLTPYELGTEISGLTSETTYTVCVYIIEYGGGMAFHPTKRVEATTLHAPGAEPGFSARGIVRGLSMPPSAPQNLQLSMTGENHLKVKWDPPATGWEPIKMREAGNAYWCGYIVTLQNTETGETVRKRPGYKKGQVIFRALESGVIYKVSVRAKIADARRNAENWVKSEWASGTVVVSD